MIKSEKREKGKERRSGFSYIEQDRRKDERRGKEERQLKKKQRKEFERHLKAQR